MRFDLIRFACLLGGLVAGFLFIWVFKAHRARARAYARAKERFEVQRERVEANLASARREAGEMRGDREAVS
jgi:hypothetical protein